MICHLRKVSSEGLANSDTIALGVAHALKTLGASVLRPIKNTANHYTIYVSDVFGYFQIMTCVTHVYSMIRRRVCWTVNIIILDIRFEISSVRNLIYIGHGGKGF